MNKKHYILVGLTAALKSLASVVFAVLQARIINELVEERIEPGKYFVTFFFLLLYIFMYVLLTKMIYSFYFDTEQQLRKEVYAGYFKGMTCGHSKALEGEDISVLTNQVETVARRYYLGKLNLYADISLLAVILAGILYVQPILGILELVLSVSILKLSGLIAGSLAEKQMKAQEANQQFTAKFLELLKGMLVIHNYKAQNKALNEFDSSNRYEEKVGLALQNGQAAVNVFSVGGNMLTYMCLFAVGSLLAIKGISDIGAIAAVSILLNEVMLYGNNASMDISGIKAAKELKSDLEDIINTPPAEVQSDVTLKDGSISADKLSFSYGDNRIFENVSFEIKSGEAVAVIGESGVGKSSLLKAIIKRETGIEGELCVGGVPVSDIPENKLYDIIAYIPQEPVIFSGSVADNITMFSEPDEGRLHKALGDAGLSNSGINLSDILDWTGSNLSGGQRMRVELARALYSGKKILLLDEAFSALDFETGKAVEAEVMKNKNMTIVSVTHRVFDDGNYDRIYRLTPEGMIDDRVSFSCEAFAELGVE